MADEMTSASSRPDICADSCCAVPRPAPRAVLWLQGVTLVWMLLECGVALYAAQAAHSVVLLAFGSDSLVELLSAAVVLLAFSPRLRISPDRAGRWAGVLLFFLAGVIALTALVADHGEPSPGGGCGAVGDLRLAGGRDAGGPRNQYALSSALD